MKKYIKVSYQMAEQYASTGRLRELAVICYLKSFHKNGVFYNFTYRSFSEKTGIPKSYLQRVLPKLEADGWIVKRDGNLCLVKQKKVSLGFNISHLRNFEVTIGTVDQILYQIRRELIANKCRRKDKMAKENETTTLSAPLGDSESSYVATTPDQLQLSYKGFGELLGMSKTSAFYFVKGLIKEGVFDKKRVFEETNIPINQYRKALRYDGDGYFVTGGRVYKQWPNLYTFTYAC